MNIIIIVIVKNVKNKERTNKNYGDIILPQLCGKQQQQRRIDEYSKKENKSRLYFRT